MDKLVEATKVTYTIVVDAGDVTVVVQKGSAGQLDYTVSYINGTAELPTWQEFCTKVEDGETIVVI